MKINVFFALALTLVLVACNNKAADKDEAPAVADTIAQVGYESLTSFFAKNSYIPPKDFCVEVIRSNEHFSQAFGTAATMGKKITMPDFEKSLVVAMIARSSKEKTSIIVDRVEKKSGKVKVYFRIETDGKQSYMSAPVSLIAIDRNEAAERIQLIVDGLLISEEDI